MKPQPANDVMPANDPAPAGASMPASAAAPLRLLFEEFEKAGIQWCSWKSNQHLNAALAAKTDIDLLFSENSHEKTKAACEKAGFVILQPAWFRTFPGMMDAFAIHPETGEIVHAHCHFKLVLGEKYLKSFILPWADALLSRRVKSSIAYTTKAADEMLLLLVREALKVRWLDEITRKEKQNVEFDWLKTQITSEQLQERALDFLPAECTELLIEAFEKNMPLDKMITLRNALKTEFTRKNFRRIKQPHAITEQFARQFASIAASAQSAFNVPWPYLRRRRTLPSGGLIIAVIGADGSGKSSVTQSLAKMWRHKIDTPRLYFGRAKLPSLLKSYIKGESTTVKTHSEVKKPANWLFVSRAAFDAGRKRFLMHCAKTMKRKGAVIICDRYPQNRFEGFNDGPLLSHLKEHKNKAIRKIALWEEKQFNKLAQTPPDIVIRLMPSLGIALARKPGENAPEFLQKKMDALKELEFSPNTKVYDINADESFEYVLRVARKIVWNAMADNKKPQTKLYECFGLPGSGKTTISSEANEKLGMTAVHDLSTMWKLMPLHAKAGTFLRSLSEEPTLWIAAIKFALQNKFWQSRDSFMRCIELPVRKTLALETLQTQSLLLNQWLLQSLWSALLNVKSEKSRGLGNLIEKIYARLPAEIFYFQLPATEAAGRISNRTDGGSRFDAMTTGEMLGSLTRADILTQEIAEAAKTAGLMLHDINTENPPDISVKALINLASGHPGA